MFSNAALIYAIREVQVNREVLKLHGKIHILLCSYNGRVVVEKYYKKQHTGNVLVTSREFGQEWIRRERSIQGVTGGTDQTSGECSLGQIIPI